jgi:uncharacterized protein YllA (UPF0747 family)
MQKFTFHRDATGLFSEQQNRLIYRQEELLNFIGLPYSRENFQRQVKQNTFTKEKRELICEALQEAYVNTPLHDAVRNNLELLKNENTYTVTTGHQIPIFTGPLFFIYKLLHVVRLSEELNAQNDNFRTVPVYWMASEDHDFDEVKWVDLFSQTIEWNTPQKGPVGRFELEGFQALKDNFESFFSGEALDEIKEILASYDGADFASATFQLVNHLFGKYGLLILNADNSKLKKSFIPILEKELLQGIAHAAVTKTDAQLVKEGMKVQVHAREINLFFLEKGSRERIIHLEDGFFIEGKGPLGSGFHELTENVISDENLRQIILTSFAYAVDFDLLTPPFEIVSQINVRQIKAISSNLSMQTGKRLGFKFEKEENDFF